MDGYDISYLTSGVDFFAVIYDDGGNILFRTQEDEPVNAGAKVYTKMNGFGALTFKELKSEIEKRGLVLIENETQIS